MPVLANLPPWAADLLNRAARQAYQTAIPVLLAALAAGHVDPVGLVVALLLVEAVTLFKFALTYLAAWTPHGGPWYVQAVDRALPAFVGVLAALQVNTWADLVAVDWPTTLYSAALAALLAVLDRAVNPPAVRLALASGGIVPGTPAIVGEGGPELIVPLKRSGGDSDGSA